MLRTFRDVDGRWEALLARAARQVVVLPLVLLTRVHVVMDLRRNDVAVSHHGL